MSSQVTKLVLISAAPASGAGRCAVDHAAPDDDPLVLVSCPVTFGPLVTHGRLPWGLGVWGLAVPAAPLPPVSAGCPARKLSRAPQASRRDVVCGGGAAA
jgi:hypothetical protein